MKSGLFLKIRKLSCRPRYRSRSETAIRSNRYLAARFHAIYSTRVAFLLSCQVWLWMKSLYRRRWDGQQRHLTERFIPRQRMARIYVRQTETFYGTFYTKSTFRQRHGYGWNPLHQMRWHDRQKPLPNFLYHVKYCPDKHNSIPSNRFTDRITDGICKSSSPSAPSILSELHKWCLSAFFCCYLLRCRVRSRMRPAPTVAKSHEIPPSWKNLSKHILWTSSGHLKSGSSLWPNSEDMRKNRLSRNEANLDGIITFRSIVQVIPSELSCGENAWLCSWNLSNSKPQWDCQTSVICPNYIGKGFLRWNAR
jgi:hypothetical protein